MRQGRFEAGIGSREEIGGSGLGPKAPVSAFRFPVVLDRGVGSSVLTFLKEAGRNVPRQTKSEPLPSHFPSGEERCRNAHASFLMQLGCQWSVNLLGA